MAADATGRVPPAWPFYGRAALLRGRNGDGGRDGAVGGLFAGCTVGGIGPNFFGA